MDIRAWLRSATAWQSTSIAKKIRHIFCILMQFNTLAYSLAFCSCSTRCNSIWFSNVCRKRWVQSHTNVTWLRPCCELMVYTSVWFISSFCFGYGDKMSLRASPCFLAFSRTSPSISRFSLVISLASRACLISASLTFWSSSAIVAASVLHLVFRARLSQFHSRFYSWSPSNLLRSFVRSSSCAASLIF